VHEPKNLNLFNPQNIPTYNPSSKHVSILIKSILLLPKRNTIIFIFIYFSNFNFTTLLSNSNYSSSSSILASTSWLLAQIASHPSLNQTKAQVTKEKCKRK
jgi:hypothetical protein